MKTRCLLLALALPLSAGAQSSPAAPRESPFSAVSGAFLALSVADLAASTRWYEEKLGLRVVMRVPSQNGAAVTVLEGGGLIVELLQLDAARPRAGSPADGAQLTHGIFKAGFVVEDFDASIARLRARGVEIAYGPFPARNGQRANAVIRDNAGNLIQLFARENR